MRHPDRSWLWLLLAGLCALAAVIVSGCQPPPTNVTTVIGDSLTMTALLEGGFPAEWDIHSMLGWQAEDAQPGVTARAADPARSPCAVAMALGQNDAAAHSDGRGDGFTTTDAQQMRTLRGTLHPATRVVWILPDYDGTDPAYAAGIDTYRAWATAEAAARGDRVADWRAVNQPTDIDSDGVHLTPAGRMAYGAFITKAVPSCA